MSTNFIKTPAQAVYIASCMEQRALAVYKRAALVFAQGRMKQVLADLIAEEQAHLDSFNRLSKLEGPVTQEEALLLDGQAAATLFAGGLTGAVREGAFDSPISLLRFAADEEERAAQRYTQFAAQAIGQTRETFLLIARQERRHLERLLGQIYLLTEEMDA